MSGSSARGIGVGDLLLDGIAGYLRSERGVTELTVDVYVGDIRRFLVDRGGGDLSELRAADVSKAVLGQVTRWSPASVRRYGCSLRSFLRYCYLVGLVERDVSAAALPVSGRRRSLLPKGITPTQAKALLRACDRRRASGRRDYAVIVLILRLGLRGRRGGALAPGGAGRVAGQVSPGGPAAVPCRCRRGDRRLPVPRPAPHGHGSRGIRAGAAAPRRPEPWRGDDHRRSRRRPCPAWRGACASAAPPRPATCCGLALRSVRSARCCDSARPDPLPPTPGSTSNGSAPLPGPGRPGRRREHPGQATR